jgi:hypothetical protein
VPSACNPRSGASRRDGRPNEWSPASWGRLSGPRTDPAPGESRVAVPRAAASQAPVAVRASNRARMHGRRFAKISVTLETRRVVNEVRAGVGAKAREALPIRAETFGPGSFATPGRSCHRTAHGADARGAGALSLQRIAAYVTTVLEQRGSCVRRA